jgi:hypothetical protein
MLPELRGRKLGCWCVPLPCHPQVIAELADHPPEKARTPEKAEGPDSTWRFLVL